MKVLKSDGVVEGKAEEDNAAEADGVMSEVAMTDAEAEVCAEKITQTNE